MSMILKEKISGISAWRGSDLASEESWVYTLSDHGKKSIREALESVKAKALTFPNFTRDDFPASGHGR